MRAGATLAMLKEAFKDWNEDDAPRLGAALSYYTIFSIAPLLLISIAVAGLVFGHEAAQGRIVEQIQGLVGRSAAEAVQSMLENARKPGQGILATLSGALTLLFGAGGAFNELRSALDTVWAIPPSPKGGLKLIVRERLASFAMVLVVGFLLLVSLVVSAGLSALELKGAFPGSGLVLEVLNVAVSLAVITVLFALIFKYLPDAHPPVAWKDVWVGAFITAALFTAGKFGIGLYLGHSSVASAYGAAGSLVLLLVWVYYSAQILFFGAELTQVWARRHGSRLGVESEDGLRAGRAVGPIPRPAAAMASRGQSVPPLAARAALPAPRPATADVGKGLVLGVALMLVLGS